MDNKLSEIEQKLFEFEGYVCSGNLLEDAKKSFLELMLSTCDSKSSTSAKNIIECLDFVLGDQGSKRNAALLLIRAASIPNFLDDFSDGNQLARKVVLVVESGAPDFAKYLRINDKQQNYQKYELIQGGHELICSGLRVLSEIPPVLQEIEALSGAIERALQHEKCNAYLQLFHWTAMRGKVSKACEQIRIVNQCNDYTFKEKFSSLRQVVNELRELVDQYESFLTQNFVSPFLAGVDKAISNLEEGSAEKFYCLIETKRRPPAVAEKKYPLYQANRLILVAIPLINKGPGIAINCVAEIGAGQDGNLLLEQDEIRLGDIPPGEFSLVLQILVSRPIAKGALVVQLGWQQLFGESSNMMFDVELLSQDANVDWGALEQLSPYSLQEADSDTFVGRAAKVQSITNRLTKPQMTSTYVTGQKRIGKTSLAKAVLRYLDSRSLPDRVYHSLYLEYGEYSAADAAGTVKALGDAILDFLLIHAPESVSGTRPDFTGTLAPLNGIARSIEAKAPEKRFVIVLDEFDEIHPEMYTFGPLAEAFFANLRTLSTRKNLAFLLVGGERMPFIIGAQGDQLNRFAYERVDYFSRGSEWSDYVELATRPVRGALIWDEPAINTLFNLTNGHPYFTNLLCGHVFSKAVTERDAEVLSSNVYEALRTLIGELDTNAFAHLWKDGIEPNREPSEVVELRRLRVLVAIGRAFRSGERRISDLVGFVGSLKLQEHEIRPVVEDFQRRDILSDDLSGLVFTLPVFEQWLAETGIKRVIANTFADELASEARRAEDNAFVTSGEIQEIVERWDPYRGRKIDGEKIRAFLQQVDSFQDQRLLFKILQHVKFISVLDTEKMLERAHQRLISAHLKVETMGKKGEKRRDVLVTYFDGPGKSGNTFARRYAKESGILLDCVMEPSRIGQRIADCVNPLEAPRGIVVVDDLLGSGKTMQQNLSKFIDEFGAICSEKRVKLFLIVLLATVEGEQMVARKVPLVEGLSLDVHVCEYLPDDAYAFLEDSVGFWTDAEERDRAKALCLKLGAGLYKQPLGFSNQGLLLTFPDTCPNNSLPILFATGKEKSPWMPIFPRHT
jgi:hypothetical protein